MKRLLSLLLAITLLLSVTACSGYNDIMREHLVNADNYYNFEATFCSYKEVDDRIFLYVFIEDKTTLDSSEVNSEELRLELVGDNCNALREYLKKEEIHKGDRITVRCSTWIYMDAAFYYVAELKTQNQTLLSFDEGLKSIVKYVDDNKALF